GARLFRGAAGRRELIREFVLAHIDSAVCAGATGTHAKSPGTLPGASSWKRYVSKLWRKRPEVAYPTFDHVDVFLDTDLHRGGGVRARGGTERDRPIGEPVVQIFYAEYPS